MDDFKTCPYCGESIKSIAVKCKYCHSNLSIDSKKFSASDEEVKKSNEFLSGIKRIVITTVVIFCLIFTAYVLNSEPEIRYVSQNEYGILIKNFTNKYSESYQFVNEISATKIRQNRKSALEKTPTNFLNWKVIFYSASTDYSGNAKVTFNDFYQRNIFYISKINPNNLNYNKLSGVNFGTEFYISGVFLTSTTNADYFVENSFTEKGSMLAPEFSIELKNISRTKKIDSEN